MKLKPNFDDLTNPTTFINHIEQLKRNVVDTKKHSEILRELLKQIQPLDFESLAFPNVTNLRQRLVELPPNSEQAKEIRRQLDKIKLSVKHYRILSIKNIVELAIKNNWSLCKKHEFIYLYNGAFWQEIDKDEFQWFLGEASERMGVRWDTAQDYRFREDLYKQFISTQYLSVTPSDNEKVLINLQNGTFEISPQRTRLRPFDRFDFLTYQLPFAYDPKAKAPLFEKYLNRVLPDPERQQVLSEYLGYLFVKNGSNALKEEKALILYGTGANGKSVFFEVICALLGTDNVSNYSLQSLTNDNGYYRAKIANKLVNYASEINSHLEASLFKQLVSGEPVEARLPYGEPFMVRQYAKLIFNCNELPKDVEHSNAYFRRFLIIPFDVTIPEEEQDKSLHIKIIQNELAGVFNWVLQGLQRLLKQGRFSECKASKMALEQYKLESDSVQMFLSEYGYKQSVSSEIPLKQMFNEYRNYCTESGFKICSLRTFSERLRNAGFQMQRKSYGMAVNAVPF